MAMKIVGVDIGSDAVRAVEIADPAKARPTLLRYHQLPLPEGAVSRGEVIEPNTVADALRQLWKIGGFTTKKVVLGIGNQRVFARDLTVPKASLKQIRESLPFLVQEMLPVPVADALLDFYPVSEDAGDHGPVVHGLLIAAVKDAVVGNIKAVKLAGLTVVDVDLIPFALSRLLVARPAIAGGVVLIDIGANTTSVVMLMDGVPQFVRIIPAGGYDLTSSLRSTLEIDTAEAEAIKRRLGLRADLSQPEDRASMEVIYRVTGELLNGLRNTVSFFVNARPEHPIERIVLTGGGSTMTGMADALAQMTGVPVTMADPFESVSVSGKLHIDELRRQSSGLSVALGLAVGTVAA